jgi:hypothetical protein
MANFTTHIGVGTIVSGALATLTLAADVVAPENLIAVTVAGVLGSILPDIDLKESRPSRALFSGLAAFFSFTALFLLAQQLSIAELWLVALGVFVLVRYGAHAIFHRMSYHRGIYHSLLAALFFACLTAALYYWMLGRHPGVAWLAGAFMLVGYLTHLVLDEMYSVDIMDTRLKVSFGTALKPIDGRKPGHSAAMAVATVIAFLLTPPMSTFVEGVGSKQLWTELHQKLLPREGWFNSITRIAWPESRRNEPAPGGASVAQPASTPITTGTLPAPEGTPKSGD